MVVTADELPGKLSSVAIVAKNTQYYSASMETVQKVDYDTMKYGYMDDVLLAQMDYVDQQYESERMEEIREINNLTAMSEKTSDKLAYEAAKKQLEEEAKKAREAAAIAEAAKEARLAALVAAAKAEYLSLIHI